MNIFAAAARALDLGFLDVGDVVLLGELFVAVGTMKGVVRHGDSPRQHHSADHCEGLRIRAVRTANVSKVGRRVMMRRGQRSQGAGRGRPCGMI